jgi:hypothetical protein
MKEFTRYNIESFKHTLYNSPKFAEFNNKYFNGLFEIQDNEIYNFAHWISNLIATRTDNRKHANKTEEEIEEYYELVLTEADYMPKILNNFSFFLHQGEGKNMVNRYAEKMIARHTPNEIDSLFNNNNEDPEYFI